MPLPSPSSQSPLRGIQALRAVAALSVVLYHAAEVLRGRLGQTGLSALDNGASGVDVFFVISGFVMVMSSAKLVGREDAARLFLVARLRRIAPLYWLVTCAKLGVAACTPGLIAGRDFGLAFIAASFLFLPVHDAHGAFKPVLPVGWTLSFEMVFYGLVALALWRRWPPLLAVPPVLLAIVLLPPNGYAISELSNPLLLEFASGMALAAIWLRGFRLPAGIASVLLCLAFAGLWLVPKTLLATRALSWGVPASLLVASTVSLEAAIAPRLARAWLALGDASYAIYLTHGFVLAALAASPAWCRFPVVFLPLALSGSAVFGWLVHVLIEQRLLGTNRPRPRTKDQRQDGAGCVLVLAGGGLTHVSGGVGTLMRNLIDTWSRSDNPPSVRIADTRGKGGILTATLYFLRGFWLVLSLGATGRVQLIHAHMTTRGSALRKSVLCATARLFGVPVILHMHGADFAEFHQSLHPLPRAMLNVAIRGARRVVVLGRSSRDFLIEQARVPEAAIDIVPNGVPRWRHAARSGGRPAHILFLGRLCARKGVPELIAALASPDLRDREWRATLAGDGDVTPFRAMLDWYGLDKKVTLPGWADPRQTEDLLADADILVLPSHNEAMPIAVLEALSAGVAVIATPVGAIPEFLENGVNALLVPPGVAAELATAIIRLLDDTSLRQRLVRAGTAIFDEQLEIGRAATRIAELYREAMARPAARNAEIEHVR